MPVNCSVCDLPCENESDAIHCVGGCQKVFHLKCATSGNVESLKTRSAKKDWQCDKCRPRKDKDSVSSVSSAKSASTPITKEFFVKTLDAFKKEVFDELRKYTAEMNEFRTTLEFVGDGLDKNTKSIEDLQATFKDLKRDNVKLQEENKEFKKTVTMLETRMRNIEQYSRQTNIEINGIPETGGENMDQLLEDVARAVNVELRKEKVVAAHRVPSFNRQRSSPVIVKFSSKQERDVWIAGFKQVRPLTADRINGTFRRDLKVFINEHLSPENKQLLARTKESASKKGYRYVWSKEGKIFVRKDEKEKCKKIENVFDLESL